MITCKQFLLDVCIAAKAICVVFFNLCIISFISIHQILNLEISNIKETNILIEIQMILTYITPLINALNTAEDLFIEENRLIMKKYKLLGKFIFLRNDEKENKKKE